MLAQASWDETREKMQIIKAAYVSRHYTQCAKYGERMLAEVKGDIHPIHLAYLNFYTALSHDTLAREATLKNRFKELNLAEKHYMAAIAALTPSGSFNTEVEEPSSPTSPTSVLSGEDHIWRVRRSSDAGSFDSTTSAASSATSFSPDTDMDFTPSKGRGRYAFPQPPRTHSPLLSKQIPTVTVPSSRPQTPTSDRLAAETSSFTAMLRNHLSKVQGLKEKTSVPSVRFQFPSPKPSPTSSRARCSQWLEEDSDAMEMIRRERRAKQFRPRFDPRAVQRLCSEALAELAQ